MKLNPQFLEVKKSKMLVILTEKEYEEILDALDAAEAQRILADESDPLVKWDDVKDKILPKRHKRPIKKINASKR